MMVFLLYHLTQSEAFLKKQERKELYATYDNYAYQLADVIIDINLDVQKESTQFGNLMIMKWICPLLNRN